MATGNSVPSDGTQSCFSNYRQVGAHASNYVRLMACGGVLEKRIESIALDKRVRAVEKRRIMRSSERGREVPA